MSWLSNLFLNSEESDLKVYFEDECNQMTLPAHSFVLRNRSKVFQAMLEEDKYREGRTGCVTLKGVHVDVAVEFLRFLYQDRISNCSVSSLTHLVYAGCIYDIPDLVSICDLQLESKVAIENACRVYQKLHLLNSDINRPKLSLARALDVMCAAAEIIFTFDMHLTLTEDVLQTFLSNDAVNVPNELDVFNAIWRWGQRQCLLNYQTDVSIPNIIEDLLPCVRHIIKPAQEETLLEFVERTRNVFLSIGKRRNGTINSKPLVPFCVPVVNGDKPIMASRKLAPRSVPLCTTSRALESLFHVSSDRLCCLIGFDVSVFVEGISLRPDDYSPFGWEFKANGTVRCCLPTSSSVVKVPNGVVFKVVAEFLSPLQLVPGKPCTVKYCGEKPIYFSTNDFMMVQKRSGTTLFTIKSLKNLALTLYVYTGHVIGDKQVQQSCV